MGGTLTLWTALGHPEVAGLVLVNPVDPAPGRRRPGDDRASCSPTARRSCPASAATSPTPTRPRSAYDGTPLAPLLSLLDDGLAPLADRYGELTVPLLLFTSRQDHVVDPAQSEHLAEHLRRAVDHRWLERSYHVATQDYDRDDIFAAAVEFAGRGRLRRLSASAWR